MPLIVTTVVDLMLNFLVLGQIPGTKIQLSFWQIFAAAALLLIAILSFYVWYRFHNYYTSHDLLVDPMYLDPKS